MNHRITLAACLVAGVLTFTCHVHAQQTGSAFGGTSTSSGLFGSRNLGQGVSGGGGTFSGTPGNAVEQAQSGAGQVQGGERFTRDGRQAGAFVGADSADTSAVFGGQTQSATGNGLEQFLNRAANRDFQNQGNAGGSSVTPLRPALKLGFTSVGPNEAAISTRMTTRLAKLPNLDILTPVSIGWEDQTAILRGRVATAHDRQMIEQLALLEPGVSRVRNELQVGRTSSKATPFDPFAPAATGAAAEETVQPIAPPIPEQLPSTTEALPPGPVIAAPGIARPAADPFAAPPPIAPTAPSFDE